MMHGGNFFYGNGFHSFGYYNPWMFYGMKAVGFLVFAIVVFFIYKALTKKQNNSNNDEIIQMLKMKLVNGEITEDEYIAKVNIITKK